MALIFLISGASKLLNYATTLEVMRSMGVMGAAALLPIATAIEILGGIALVTGFQLQWSSLLLAAYLVPVTLVFHRFWAFSGVTRQVELVELLKNTSIMGGLVMISLYQSVLQAFTGGTLIELKRDSRREQHPRSRSA